MFKKIKSFFLNHYLAIIFACLVSLVVALPQFLFIWQTGNDYKGFNIFATDAEDQYLARINEVYDGHYTNNQPFLSSGKNLPYIASFFSELIMGLTGRLFHLDLGALMIFYRLVGPLSLYLLIYFFILEFKIVSRLVAWLSPAVIILASQLFTAPLSFWQALNNRLNLDGFVYYARPINPQFSSLILFLFLLVFYSYINYPKWLTGLVSSVLFGLSFYTYPYLCVYLAVILALSCFWFLFQKNYGMFKKLILIFFSGITIAIPYFLNLYQAINDFSFFRVRSAYGLLNSRGLIFDKLAALTLIAVLIIYYLNKKSKKPAVGYLLALSLGLFISLNQNVITGRIMQLGHFHWYYVIPILIISLIILFFFLLERYQVKKNWQIIIFIFLFCSSIYYGLAIQLNSYGQQYLTYYQLQKYQPFISWFNSQAKKEAVVYTPFDSLGTSAKFNNLILAYTHLNVYYNIYMPLVLNPYPDYFMDNLFIALKIAKVEPENLINYLKNHQSDLGNYFGLSNFFDKLPWSSEADSRFGNLIDRYNIFYNKSLAEDLKKYPVDYILWDSWANPELHLNELLNVDQEVNQVYNKQGIIIYQVR